MDPLNGFASQRKNPRNAPLKARRRCSTWDPPRGAVACVDTSISGRRDDDGAKVDELSDSCVQDFGLREAERHGDDGGKPKVLLDPREPVENVGQGATTAAVSDANGDNRDALGDTVGQACNSRGAACTVPEGGKNKIRSGGNDLDKDTRGSQVLHREAVLEE